MTPGGEYAKGRGMTGVWARMAALVLALALGLAGCGTGPQGGLHPGETAEIRALIQTYARVHDIPESLLHSVIQRESGYNAAARNGPYYGLMQILPQTARTMGYEGPAEGLLDAETNLIYAGRYLRGAWIVSGGNEDAAIRWYAAGYYYEAKRLGLLEETGLR
jgi:soluble lytic murein transglycosylase-like protein